MSEQPRQCPNPEQPAPKRGRPRDTGKDAKILAAAQELLAELGYEQLTREAVAAKVGVSKPTLYRRWVSRAELVAAAVGDLQWSSSVPDNGSLRADFLELAGVWFAEDPMRDAIFVRLLAALPGDEQLRELYTARVSAPRSQALAQVMGNALAHAGIPVALGPHDALARSYGGRAPHVHGINGIGEVRLPDAGLELSPESAPEMLVRLARALAGELRVIAIGPLTNIASALHLDPELPSLVQELTIMGGAALAPGSITAVSETNIHNDPEAAAEVFAAGWEIVLAPLDVTMDHVLEEHDQQTLAASASPAVQAVAAMLGYYLGFYRSVFGRRCSAMHDPPAAAIAIGKVRPASAPYARAVVDATDGPGRGQTICDLRGRHKGHPKPEGARCRVVLAATGDASGEIVRGTLALANAPLAARP
ncbi:TetR family transcriptional regulator [Paeniglutamicibacter gangotriensis]|uniref:TetR family transcriptional regulator n=1 Tax=Paeniglutamicibacter gangotriensis TaxID=254787 RepID=A0A5B0EBD6_9MICC|nr:nucleoside hydrolase [Paeniglutamicibacter gangotriensis]KAA0976183.1 TetR family transcriptional regulator [Paeniglutamicibacter gangotriensis]